MPIEVPDTRAFGAPAPRRRRAVAPKPELRAEPAAPVQPPGPVAESPAEVEPAFRKPVRRRRSSDAVAATVPATAPGQPVAAEPPAPADVPAGSAFSRPVRRRPKSALAPAATPAPPVAAEPSTVTDPVPVAAPVQTFDVGVSPAAVVEERRGIVGVADELAEVTDTVVVRLAGTRYAVSMDVVAEVGRPPHVTRVPGVPSWIAGVANWRGRVLPVLDLRVLLGAPTPELGLAGRILVLTRDGMTIAFLAERVEGVVSLELAGLEPVLATLSRTTASVLAGQLTHPDGPIAVLDLDTVFALRSQLPRVRRAG